MNASALPSCADLCASTAAIAVESTLQVPIGLSKSKVRCWISHRGYNLTSFYFNESVSSKSVYFSCRSSLRLNYIWLGH